MSGAPGYQDDLLAKAHVPEDQLDGTAKEGPIEATSARESSDDEYPDKPTAQRMYERVLESLGQAAPVAGAGNIPSQERRRRARECV